MMQPDLFEAAAARRDWGIDQSYEHAEADSAGWQDGAAFWLHIFVLKRGVTPFMAEDFVAFAREKGLADPPDKRAFGGVMQRAKREGWIKADGYAPSRSSNLSPKVRWRGCWQQLEAEF